ncbi:hypothetical protein [Methylobacterium sp. Leaf118]|uniref:hypothetical protein n=1 Tax=Methylobacterium sp. Leaf118 TaxID=2876562 RepID=UPI001E2FAD34|nr:hypothetical protein [Methylobacterium sp. Leaf118]
MRIIDKHQLDADTLRRELEEARRVQEQCLASGVNHSTWMGAAFSGADLAYGYWKEGTDIACALLKGEERLKAIAAGSEAVQLRILRVPCREEAEAAAMCLVWGDDRAAA